MGFDVMYERVQQELAETRIALAAMTDRADAESLRAERVEAKLEAVEHLPRCWHPILDSEVVVASDLEAALKGE